MKGKVIFSYEWWNANDQLIPIPPEDEGPLRHFAWHAIAETIKNHWYLEGTLHLDLKGATYCGKWSKTEEVE